MLGWQGSMGGSTIWKGFKKSWLYFISLLKWHFGGGTKILIGHERMQGNPNSVNLSYELIRHLNMRGLFYLAQIIMDKVNGSPIWM